MRTTADFLDDLRAKLALPSDNKLALHLGMKRSQLGRYRGRHETFSDETAHKIAAQLGIAPDYVMACMAWQRAKTPESRTAWERIAAKVAAAVLLGLGLAAPAPAPANLTIPVFASNRGSEYTYAPIRPRRRTRRAAAALSTFFRHLSSALARWHACDDFPRD